MTWKETVTDIKELIQEDVKDTIGGSIARQVKEITKDIKRNIFITLFVMLTILFMHNENYPEWYQTVVLGLYFILSILIDIDSRIPIAAALILLIITPIYLIKNLENYANFLATIAYFFLVIGVIKQFIEYLKESKEQTTEEKMKEIFKE